MRTCVLPKNEYMCVACILHTLAMAKFIPLKPGKRDNAADDDDDDDGTTGFITYMFMYCTRTFICANK